MSVVGFLARLIVGFGLLAETSLYTLLSLLLGSAFDSSYYFRNVLCSNCLRCHRRSHYRHHRRIVAILVGRVVGRVILGSIATVIVVIV